MQTVFLLFLSVSTRAAVGQFCRPVRTAKIESPGIRDSFVHWTKKKWQINLLHAINRTKQKNDRVAAAVKLKAFKLINSTWTPVS